MVTDRGRRATRVELSVRWRTQRVALDNAEHLLPPRRQHAELVAACPELAVLATTVMTCAPEPILTAAAVPGELYYRVAIVAHGGFVWWARHAECRA